MSSYSLSAYVQYRDRIVTPFCDTFLNGRVETAPQCFLLYCLLYNFESQYNWRNKFVFENKLVLIVVVVALGHPWRTLTDWTVQISVGCVRWGLLMLRCLRIPWSWRGSKARKRMGTGRQVWWHVPASRHRRGGLRHGWHRPAQHSHVRWRRCGHRGGW